MFEQNRSALSKLASAAADIYGGASDRLYGMKEVGASMLSGAVAQPVSGLGGLVALASGRNPTKTINSLQGLMTYQPKTEFGREYANGLARLMAPVAEISEDARGRLGDGAYRLTGSPAAAALAYSTPEALAAYLGVRKVMTPKTTAVPLNTGAYKGQRGAYGFDASGKRLRDAFKKPEIDRGAIVSAADDIRRDWMETGNGPDISPIASNPVFFDGEDFTDLGQQAINDLYDTESMAQASRSIQPPPRFDMSAPSDVEKFAKYYADRLGKNYSVGASSKSLSRYIEMDDGRKIRISNHELPDHYTDRADFEFRTDKERSLLPLRSFIRGR